MRNQRIKKFIKTVISPWFIRGRAINWQTDLLHVLIKSFPGFHEKDWLDTFKDNFLNWQRFAEVKFFRNFAERDLLISGANIYISTWFSKDLLRQSAKIKLVQLITSGVEFLGDFKNFDNVQIATAAGLSSQGVAEHVVMLMLGLDRRLDLAINRQKFWRWKQNGILNNIKGLKGHTVGIIGLGNNGYAVASLVSNFGVKIIGIDMRSTLHIKGVEICRGGLPELLSISDFIVLCVPLTEETRKMISYEEFKQMKADAYLINVSRGEVIDECALAWALKNGIIAGAALDVLNSEPPPFFHPLRGCPNLIITPHVAGNIYTFREAIRRRFVSNVKALINGQALEGLLPDLTETNTKNSY